jgi:hypothetical protein
METSSDWRMLENENYHKIYSKLKFRKEKLNVYNDKDSSSKLLLKTLESNSNNIQILDRSIDKGSETNATSLNSSFTANPNFDFLTSDIYSTQPHIITIFNKILNNDKLFFNWTAKNKEECLINGVHIYECKLKSPSINKTFLKSVFKNSFDIKSSVKKIGSENSLITLNINLNKKNIEEISEVASYEIFISDEENEYTWMGLNRFKVLNTSSIEKDSKILQLKFNLLTSKKGIIEVNKFSLLINPKNQIEKSFTISNITNAIILDI